MSSPTVFTCPRPMRWPSSWRITGPCCPGKVEPGRVGVVRVEGDPPAHVDVLEPRGRDDRHRDAGRHVVVPLERDVRVVRIGPRDQDGGPPVAVPVGLEHLAIDGGLLVGGPSYSKAIPVAAETRRTASWTSAIEPGGASEAFTT